MTHPSFRSLIAAVAVSAAIVSMATPSSAMNKKDLIAVMAKEARISKSAATRAIDSFLNNSKAALKRGERVILVGFGTLSVVTEGGRSSRDPKTGETITIGGTKSVHFKAGKALNKAIK